MSDDLQPPDEYRLGQEVVWEVIFKQDGGAGTPISPTELTWTSKRNHEPWASRDDDVQHEAEAVGVYRLRFTPPMPGFWAFRVVTDNNIKTAKEKRFVVLGPGV